MNQSQTADQLQYMSQATYRNQSLLSSKSEPNGFYQENASFKLNKLQCNHTLDTEEESIMSVLQRFQKYLIDHKDLAVRSLKIVRSLKKRENDEMMKIIFIILMIFIIILLYMIYSSINSDLSQVNNEKTYNNIKWNKN